MSSVSHERVSVSLPAVSLVDAKRFAEAQRVTLSAFIADALDK